MSTLKTTNIANPSATGTNIVLNSDDSTTLGTAKLTTLADSAGANTSTPAAIANGIAKAWVNFNGTSTVAIRASYNVSSITDNGVGDYTVNFTTAMVDANYVPVFTNHVRTNQAAGTSPPGLASIGNSDVPNASLTSSGFTIIHRPASANSDPDMIGVAIFR